jgi:hypothetical protein
MNSFSGTQRALKSARTVLASTGNQLQPGRFPPQSQHQHCKNRTCIGTLSASIAASTLQEPYWHRPAINCSRDAFRLNRSINPARTVLASGRFPPQSQHQHCKNRTCIRTLSASIAASTLQEPYWHRPAINCSRDAFRLNRSINTARTVLASGRFPPQSQQTTPFANLNATQPRTAFCELRTGRPARPTLGLTLGRFRACSSIKHTTAGEHAACRRITTH